MEYVKLGRTGNKMNEVALLATFLIVHSVFQFCRV